MKRFFMLKYNKGIYVGNSLSEIFNVMYLLSKYDKHDCCLPVEYSDGRYALEQSVFEDLCLEGMDEYKIGSFVIRSVKKESIWEESEVVE